MSQVSLYKPDYGEQPRNENAADLDPGRALAIDDQFSGWWLDLQICHSRKLRLHSCSELQPHLASTKGLNDWLSNVVKAKQLREANWVTKLYWLKPCFHEDQERLEQLEPFIEQLRRRLSSSHRFYHLFHKCDDGFCQPKLHHSSSVAFVESKRIIRLSTRFSRRLARESISKNSFIVIFEHLSMIELKYNDRIFSKIFSQDSAQWGFSARNLWWRFPERSFWIFLHKIIHIFHRFFSSFWICFCPILFLDWSKFLKMVMYSYKCIQLIHLRSAFLISKCVRKDRLVDGGWDVLPNFWIIHFLDSENILIQWGARLIQGRNDGRRSWNIHCLWLNCYMTKLLYDLWLHCYMCFIHVRRP